MNTMRVGAEDGKSLVPVDLAGVGWRRLRCDATGLANLKLHHRMHASSLMQRERNG